MKNRRAFLLASLASGALIRPSSLLAAVQSDTAPKSRTAPLDPAVLGSAEAPLEGIKIAPEFYPVIVNVKREFVPGSIIVSSSRHFLYFITHTGKAIRYGVAVGKAELQFRGEAVVGRKVEWPSWKPTPEMVARNPAAYARYAENGMEGGPKNPLGARAIYLFQNGFDTAVRIHGTIEPNSIGRSVSNGCLRMVNAHVIDLYNRVELNAPVTVF
ncbi:MAG: L,D-transpeptidase [Paracoccaceae bacterium]